MKYGLFALSLNEFAPREEIIDYILIIVYVLAWKIFEYIDQVFIRTIPFALTVSMMLYAQALESAPSMLAENNQFFLPTALSEN